ncbi:hypothetical protein [Acinetobacter gyllenbergii]|uniref:hypothetical protein n=1 Tax=Acinetobacter gyllenbergii TaxID=134534 RepID=UPI00241F49FA|nr:hypothetical protein [Acinetobacter gyllenbergii]
MSKWNESKCGFDKLKKCIKEFEETLEEFENNLEEQLSLVRQRPAEFTDDLLGLVNLMDKSNPQNGDADILDRKWVVNQLLDAFDERLNFIADLSEKATKSPRLILIEKLGYMNLILLKIKDLNPNWKEELL